VPRWSSCYASEARIIAAFDCQIGQKVSRQLKRISVLTDSIVRVSRHFIWPPALTRAVESPSCGWRERRCERCAREERALVGFGVYPCFEANPKTLVALSFNGLTATDSPRSRARQQPLDSEQFRSAPRTGGTFHRQASAEANRLRHGGRGLL
jgi:hypothetical protein